MKRLRKGLRLLLLMTAAAFAENVLHSYNWNDYIEPTTVVRFEKSCNCNEGVGYPDGFLLNPKGYCVNDAETTGNSRC